MRKTSEATYSSLDFEEDAPQAAPSVPARKSLTSRVIKRMIFGSFLTIGAGIVYNAVSLQDMRHQAPLFGKTTTVAVAAKPAEAPPAAAKLLAHEAQAPASAAPPLPVVRQIDMGQQADARKAGTGDAIARELARTSDDRRDNVSPAPVKAAESTAHGPRKIVQSQARQKLLKIASDANSAHKSLAAEAKAKRASLSVSAGTSKEPGAARDNARAQPAKKQPDAIASLLKTTN